MGRSTGSDEADDSTTAPQRVSWLSRIVFWLGVAGGIFGLREAAFSRNRSDDRRR